MRCTPHIFVVLLLLLSPYSLFAQEQTALVEINRRYSCYLVQRSSTDGGQINESFLVKFRSDKSVGDQMKVVPFRRQLKKWDKRQETLRNIRKEKQAKKVGKWKKKARRCRAQRKEFTPSFTEIPLATPIPDPSPSPTSKMDPEQSPTPTPTPIPTPPDPIEVARGCDVAANGAYLRVINGERCNEGNSPVVYLLIFENDNFDEFYECTGTAIRKDKVLFAAHCVTNSVTHIMVIPGGDFSKHVFAERVDTHNQYNPFSSSPAVNDLAIVSLASPLPTKVFPIISREDKVNVGETAIIAGYGLIDKETEGQAGDNDPSGELYAGRVVISEVKREELVTTFNYTGQPDGDSSNTCLGDSGGPLLAYRNNRWVVAGVTSYGDEKNCGPNDHSGYTNLLNADNRSFINDVLR